MTEKKGLTSDSLMGAVVMFRLLEDPSTRGVLQEYQDVMFDMINYPESLTDTQPDFGPSHLKSLEDINGAIRRDLNQGLPTTYLLRHGSNQLKDPMKILEIPGEIVYTIPTSSTLSADAEGNVTYGGYSLLGRGEEFSHRPMIDGLKPDRTHGLFTTRRWVEDIMFALNYPDKEKLSKESVVNDGYLLRELYYDHRTPSFLSQIARERCIELTGYDPHDAYLEGI